MTEPRPPAPPLDGRERELALFAELLADRSGSRALVIEGEAGIGKSSLWRALVDTAEGSGWRVLNCVGSQAETALSFAGLADLLRTVSDAELARLPAPQCQALEVALLRRDPMDPDRRPGLDIRTLGTALVSLLRELSIHTPVVVAMDDAHWLDAATRRTLEFALRRLDDERIRVVAMVRADRGSLMRVLSGIPADQVHHHRVGPLGPVALRSMLAAVIGSSPSGALVRRIAKASGGNPLHALQIAQLVTSAPDHDGRGPLPLPDGLLEVVARRLRPLPERTRLELLRASALATPSLEHLDVEALAPAEDASIIRTHIDGRVEFVHPLFAAGIYGSATAHRRAVVHRELAAAVGDIEERALHLQRSSRPPDPLIADVLSDAAASALRRGAVDIAAELAEQAVRFTPRTETDLRAHRSVAAARHHLAAGERSLAERAARDVLRSSSGGARSQALQVLAELTATDDLPGAVTYLEQALSMGVDSPIDQVRLEASLAFALTGLMDLTGAAAHAARALALAEDCADDAALAEVVSLNCVIAALSGEVVSAAMLERALQLEDLSAPARLNNRPSMMVGTAYEYVGRFDDANRVLRTLAESLKERGLENELPFVFAHLAQTTVLLGDFATAAQQSEDAVRAAADAGQDLMRCFALRVRASVRSNLGDHASARVDAADALELAQSIGWPVGVNESTWMLGAIAVGEGDMGAAVEHLAPLIPMIGAMPVLELPLAVAVPDIVEAMVGVGRTGEVASLADRLLDRGLQTARPWSIALGGRCVALVRAAEGDLIAAEKAALVAVDAHVHLSMPFELARTLLVLGQVQRRAGHRRAARESLGRARRTFEELGAPTWAERAARELRRIGVRRSVDGLTDGEAAIVALAATGVRNKDIAARLFISVRTVESNLARAYRKLGVGSKAELATLVARSRDPEG